MSFSLIHYHRNSGCAAVLSATGGVSIGGYVPHCWRGLGACATQGLFTNPWYPQHVHKGLETHGAKELVRQLIQLDHGHANRQCLIIDRQGEAAVLQGVNNERCLGALLRPSVAVAGNMLANDQVLPTLLYNFLEGICQNTKQVMLHDVEPLYNHDYQQQIVEALLQALQGAIAAGGDRRGTFSAALRVERWDYPPIDIRVDWEPQDLSVAMRRVWQQVQQPDFQNFLTALPRAVQVGQD